MIELETTEDYEDYDAGMYDGITDAKNYRERRTFPPNCSSAYLRGYKEGHTIQTTCMSYLHNHERTA